MSISGIPFGPFLYSFLWNGKSQSIVSYKNSWLIIKWIEFRLAPFYIRFSGTAEVKTLFPINSWLIIKSNMLKGSNTNILSTKYGYCNASWSTCVKRCISLIMLCVCVCWPWHKIYGWSNTKVIHILDF